MRVLGAVYCNANKGNSLMRLARRVLRRHLRPALRGKRLANIPLRRLPRILLSPLTVAYWIAALSPTRMLI